MSLREERCLATLITRLQGITGVVRVDLEPEDDHADLDSYPAIAVLPGEVVAIADPQRVQSRALMPVIVRGLTKAQADEGNDDLPLTTRTAGYALLKQMLPALFPNSSASAYVDRLDGNAMRFEWKGHTVYPSDDGGKTVGVYIDCEVEFVLTLNDPDK